MPVFKMNDIENIHENEKFQWLDTRLVYFGKTGHGRRYAYF